MYTGGGLTMKKLNRVLRQHWNKYEYRCYEWRRSIFFLWVNTVRRLIVNTGAYKIFSKRQQTYLGAWVISMGDKSFAKRAVKTTHEQ